METLLKLIQGNIKRKLPATFGIIFDGWTCEGEHYIGIFATWTRDDGSVVKRLIACGVQDLPEGEEAVKGFGFAAEDIGDYLFDVLAKYDRDYSAIQFMTGDNAYVDSRLCNLSSLTKTHPMLRARQLSLSSSSAGVVSLCALIGGGSWILQLLKCW